MKLEKGKVYKNHAMPGYVFAKNPNDDNVLYKPENKLEVRWVELDPEILMAVKDRFAEHGIMAYLTPEAKKILEEFNMPAKLETPNDHEADKMRYFFMGGRSIGKTAMGKFMKQRFDEIKKQPLGLMPRNIWIENRIDDISAAIVRYAEAGKEIPMEWIGERNELISQLKEEK